MPLPYFYNPEITAEATLVSLNETSSKHAIQALRMKVGEELQLTNGKGLLANAIIEDADKKKCIVKIIQLKNQSLICKDICLAVSPTKNINRIEWLIEKITEIGIQKIILLQCDRTEKNNIRIERLNNILISAMLQSQQVYLPELINMTPFDDVIKERNYQEKFIAHCLADTNKINLKNANPNKNKIVLIGPEGDFTKHEIALALEQKFVPVSLGQTRLRTETAALVAVALLSL